MKIVIAGAGLSGAVIARELGSNGHFCIVIDERAHIGGNCYTERDKDTGIMIHRYGPHIFHTDNAAVWEYITQFCKMMPYVNRVKTTVNDLVFSMPINLHTINQFFEKAFTPDEAMAFVQSIGQKDIETPENFEEQALKFVGEDLYRTFFYGYTKKQWGMEPSKLPASILKRLPVRFVYDDNYFNHKYQGIPADGYTRAIECILDHPNIEIRLNCKFEEFKEEADHIFYSGPLDRYFDYKLGRLGYRTLHFEELRKAGTYQGTAVMNYGDENVPFTRITEHKYFAPWEIDQFNDTVCFREFSRSCGLHDVPYYPIRLAKEKTLLDAYNEAANQLTGVTFIGRLGAYSYLDMDTTIERSLATAKQALNGFETSTPIPVFGSFN